MDCAETGCSYAAFSGQDDRCYWHWKVRQGLLVARDEDRPLCNPADVAEKLEIGALIAALEKCLTRYGTLKVERRSRMRGVAPPPRPRFAPGASSFRGKRAS